MCNDKEKIWFSGNEIGIVDIKQCRHPVVNIGRTNQVVRWPGHELPLYNKRQEQFTQAPSPLIKNKKLF